MIRSKPWLILISLTILAIVSGLSIRHFVTPTKITNLLKSQTSKLDNRHFDINFSEARLILADGFKAKLGLLVSDVSLISKNPCGDKLSSKTLYLPVSFLGLLQKEVRFSNLILKNSNFVMGSSACKKKVVQSLKSVEEKNQAIPAPSKTQHKRVQKFISRLEKFLSEQWETEYEKLRAKTHGLSLINFHLLKATGAEVLQVDRLNFKFNTDKIKVHGDIVLDASSGSDKTYKTIGLKGAISPEDISFKFLGRIFEGRSYLDIQLSPKQNMLLSTRARVKDFPIRGVLKILKEEGLIRNTISPKPSWLNCSLTYNGPARKLLDQYIQAKGCEIKGELGEWNAQAFKFKLGQKIKDLILNVSIQKLPVDAIIETFGKKKNKSVFGNYGFIEGDLSYYKDQGLNFDGHIRDLRLSFSNSGQRASQAIDLIPVKVNLLNKIYSFDVEGIIFREGKSSGAVTGFHNMETKSSLVKVNFSELEFSNRVQEVLVGKTLSPVKAVFQIQSQDGNPTWEGELSASKISGESYEANDLKISGIYKNKNFEAKVESSLVQIQPESSYHKPLYKILMDPVLKEKDVQFANVSSDIIMDETGGSWSNLKAEKPLMSFMSQGRWQRDGEAVGEMQVKSEVLPLLYWKVSGTPLEPKVDPSKATMLWIETVLKDDSQADSPVINFFKKLFK